MSIKNREKFLDHLASHLGRSRKTEAIPKPVWKSTPQWDVYHDYSVDELVEVLKQQCDSIHTTFKKTNRKKLAHIIRETITDYHGKSVVISHDERNDDYNLTAFYNDLKHDSIDVHKWDPAKKEENQTFAERADIGITFSDLTLAESGTITLFNDKYNGRSISLLPESYIAIIPKNTIVPRLTQATKIIHDEHQKGNKVSSCISFISGPSNSADIEMNLIVGVHGPVNVTYIVVDD